MTHSLPDTHQAHSFSLRTLALSAVLLAVGLLAASSVSATYEQTGIFAGALTPPAEPGVFPEEVQLGGVSGMAVNVSGAGGVAAGTVYAATIGPAIGTTRVAMFQPSGTGLEFKLGWEVTKTEGPYERCGPPVETLPPRPQCPTRPEAGVNAVDIDIDQATGNVYVLSDAQIPAGGTVVTVFKPDGSEVITRFGETATGSTASTPGKVHESRQGGLAVDNAGTVYLFDLNAFDNFYHRLMVFKPTTPGNLKTYAYVSGGDIGAGFQGEGRFPSMPVTDAAGDIYVAGPTHIEKYTPSQPKPSICKFDLAIGGITAMTVNRATGEPFYYTSKNKQVHPLGACSGGKFTEVPPAMAVAPERAELFALAFDPARQLDQREPGVLYGGAPGPVPGSGGKGQPGTSALGYIFAQVAEVDPVVESESVSHVSSSSAELGAEINPKGSETSYVFQYISEAAYEENEPADRFAGAAEAPLGGGLVGSGQKAIGVGAALSGLAPDTSYHYRAIATSHCSSDDPEKVCEDVGADQSFHTFAIEAPGLPDGRVYELVSPVEKNGGQVLPAEPITSSCGKAECKPGAGYSHFPMQSSPDGEAVVYEGTPFSTEGAVIENEYIARRTAAGWVTTNLTPPLLQSKGAQGYKAFDASLTKGVLAQIGSSLSPEAPSDYANLYAQPTADPLALEPLIVSEPPNRAPGNGQGSLRLTYAGASADFSQQIFEANDALSEETPFAPAAVDPGDPEKESNLYEWTGGGLRLVNVLPGNTETVPGAVLGSGTLLKSGDPNTPATVVTGAISDDGSRIFWTSKAGQLYVREDGEVTVEIEAAGKFLAASADGSKVLLSDGCLYDLAEKACEDLTAGLGGFLGIAGHSEDLSDVYFVDTAVLSEDENDQGQKAQAGKPNLYAWNEGTLGFIATLLAADNGSGGDWQASPSARTAEASPAGRFLTFLSQARLTGYDNTGPCQLEGSSGKYLDAPCPEAFLYDSATGELTCASCNPSNTRPLGASTLRLIKDARGSLPQPRYLSDEGRLYFDTRDSLSPADTNDGVEDVYQYEPEGVGSCKRAGGCVSLVSAGAEAVDSNFLTMDEAGKSVFFTSRDQLVLKDKDQLIDLYVAREGGGIPAETEVGRGECQGEACVPLLSPPNDPTPASSSVNGAGNVDEKKAKKHKKKRAKKHKKKAHKRAARHGNGGGK